MSWWLCVLRLPHGSQLRPKRRPRAQQLRQEALCIALATWKRAAAQRRPLWWVVVWWVRCDEQDVMRDVISEVWEVELWWVVVWWVRCDERCDKWGDKWDVMRDVISSEVWEVELWWVVVWWEVCEVRCEKWSCDELWCDEICEKWGVRSGAVMSCGVMSEMWEVRCDLSTAPAVTYLISGAKLPYKWC